jgi:hypothetical protein|tara:strand:+ start:88 stop:738 length:651 start_codon:yes stop_codon:yes gene_type:complete
MADDIESKLAEAAQKFLKDKNKKVPTEISRQVVEEIVEEPKVSAAEAIDMIIDNSRKKTQGASTKAEQKAIEDLAKTKFKNASPKLIEAFMKNRGKLAKSVLPVAVGGIAGILPKVAEAAEYAMKPTATGRDPESLSTEQIKTLLAAIEGGGLTEEQRLATAEFPPEVRDAEYLKGLLAKKQRPIKQGAAMQEDLKRATKLSLKEQVQQLTQGTAQ